MSAINFSHAICDRSNQLHVEQLSPSIEHIQTFVKASKLKLQIRLKSLLVAIGMLDPKELRLTFIPQAIPKSCHVRFDRLQKVFNERNVTLFAKNTILWEETQYTYHISRRLFFQKNGFNNSLFLHGAAAHYVFDLIGYYRELICEFFTLHKSKHEISDQTVKEIDHLLNQLQEHWEDKHLPNDIDWQEKFISNENGLQENEDMTIQHLVVSTKYLVSYETIATCMGRIKPTKKPFFPPPEPYRIFQFGIRSVAENQAKTDLIIGTSTRPYLFCKDAIALRLSDYFDAINNHLPIPALIPECKHDQFAQMASDEILGVILMEEIHIHDFRATLTALRHLSRGCTIVEVRLKLVNCFQNMLDDLYYFHLDIYFLTQLVKAQLKDHSVDPLEYLFNVYSYCLLAAKPCHQTILVAIWTELQKIILEKMENRKEINPFSQHLLSLIAKNHSFIDITYSFMQFALFFQVIELSSQEKISLNTKDSHQILIRYGRSNFIIFLETFNSQKNLNASLFDSCIPKKHLKLKNAFTFNRSIIEKTQLNSLVGLIIYIALQRANHLLSSEFFNSLTQNILDGKIDQDYETNIVHLLSSWMPELALHTLPNQRVDWIVGFLFSDYFIHAISLWKRESNERKLEILQTLSRRLPGRALVFLKNSELKDLFFIEGLKSIISSSLLKVDILEKCEKLYFNLNYSLKDCRVDALLLLLLEKTEKLKSIFHAQTLLKKLCEAFNVKPQNVIQRIEEQCYKAALHSAEEAKLKIHFLIQEDQLNQALIEITNLEPNLLNTLETHLFLNQIFKLAIQEKSLDEVHKLWKLLDQTHCVNDCSLQENATQFLNTCFNEPETFEKLKKAQEFLELETILLNLKELPKIYLKLLNKLKTYSTLKSFPIILNCLRNIFARKIYINNYDFCIYLINYLKSITFIEIKQIQKLLNTYQTPFIQELSHFNEPQIVIEFLYLLDHWQCLKFSDLNTSEEILKIFKNKIISEKIDLNLIKLFIEAARKNSFSKSPLYQFILLRILQAAKDLKATESIVSILNLLKNPLELESSSRKLVARLRYTLSQLEEYPLLLLTLLRWSFQSFPHTKKAVGHFILKKYSHLFPTWPIEIHEEILLELSQEIALHPSIKQKLPEAIERFISCNCQNSLIIPLLQKTEFYHKEYLERLVLIIPIETPNLITGFVEYYISLINLERIGELAEAFRQLLRCTLPTVIYYKLLRPDLFWAAFQANTTQEAQHFISDLIGKSDSITGKQRAQYFSQLLQFRDSFKDQPSWLEVDCLLVQQLETLPELRNEYSRRFENAIIKYASNSSQPSLSRIINQALKTDLLLAIASAKLFQVLFQIGSFEQRTEILKTIVKTPDNEILFLGLEFIDKILIQNELFSSEVIKNILVKIITKSTEENILLLNKIFIHPFLKNLLTCEIFQIVFFQFFEKLLTKFAKQTGRISGNIIETFIAYLPHLRDLPEKRKFQIWNLVQKNVLSELFNESNLTSFKNVFYLFLMAYADADINKLYALLNQKLPLPMTFFAFRKCSENQLKIDQKCVFWLTNFINLYTSKKEKSHAFKYNFITTLCHHLLDYFNNTSLNSESPYITLLKPIIYACIDLTSETGNEAFRGAQIFLESVQSKGWLNTHAHLRLECEFAIARRATLLTNQMDRSFNTFSLLRNVEQNIFIEVIEKLIEINTSRGLIRTFLLMQTFQNELLYGNVLLITQCFELLFRGIKQVSFDKTLSLAEAIQEILASLLNPEVNQKEQELVKLNSNYSDQIHNYENCITFVIIDICPYRIKLCTEFITQIRHFLCKKQKMTVSNALEVVLRELVNCVERERITHEIYCAFITLLFPWCLDTFKAGNNEDLITSYILKDFSNQNSRMRAEILLCWVFSSINPKYPKCLINAKKVVNILRKPQFENELNSDCKERLRTLEIHLNTSLESSPNFRKAPKK